MTSAIEDVAYWQPIESKATFVSGRRVEMTESLIWIEKGVEIRQVAGAQKRGDDLLPLLVN